MSDHPIDTNSRAQIRPGSGRFVDISGMVFNRLTVLFRIPPKHGGTQAWWRCRCECGTDIDASSQSIRTGSTSSCGCFKRDEMSRRLSKPGRRKNGKKSPTYNTWRGMIERCTNAKNSHFKDYGGRGITVCDRWRSFDNFLLDMGERPDDHSIDRINNDGNYEPKNCRWAKSQQQARNTQRSLRVEYNGQSLTPEQISKMNGVKIDTIWARIRKGWPAKDIVEIGTLKNASVRHQLENWPGE